MGFIYSENQDPIYEARGTILVRYTGGSQYAVGLSNFSQSQELAATYRRLVTAKPFLDSVELNGASVSADTDSSPPALVIKAKHSNPVVAATAAQTVSDRFIGYAIEQRLGEIARLQSAAAAQGFINVQELVAAQFTAVDTLSPLEPVETPGNPVVPRTRRNVLMGGILGMVLAAGLALLLDSLRDTVRFPDQLERRFGVTGLGTIFKWSPQEVEERELVLWSSPKSTYAEAFRQIRANLEFATANPSEKVFLVSSPGPGEGKTTIVANLAIAVAQTGKRVVMVDGDLRRPSLHKLTNTDQRDPGLSNILADHSASIESAIQKTEMEGVDLIPSGPTPPNPAELLGSPRMAALLDHLRREYDMAFVDSPPVLLVADGSILASQVGGAVIVVDGLSTRSSSLQACLDTLRNTQVSLVGVIINKLKRPRFGYGYSYPHYYYYYRSYYKYYSEEELPVNGAGPFYRRLGQRAKVVWDRIRGA